MLTMPRPVEKHNGNDDMKMPTSAADAVEPSGGPPDSTFQWSVLTCRLIVLLVWSITPLSWMYVIWRVASYFSPHDPSSISTSQDSNPISLVRTITFRCLFGYAIIEVVFSIYYRYLMYKVQERTSFPQYSRAFLRQTLARALEDGMKQEGEQAIAKSATAETEKSDSKLTRRPRRATFSNAHFSQLSFLDERNKLSRDDPRAVEWRKMFQAWFLGAPWESLKRDNVLEWLSWSFFGMHYEEIVEEYKQEGSPPIPKEVQSAGEVLAEPEGDDVEGAGGKMAFVFQGLYMLEARSGMKLPEGRNPNVSCIRLHLDPVKITSRPFAKYLVTGFFNLMIERRASRSGFVKVSHAGLTYLIRMPELWKPGSEETRPVLFLHGLGMGLAQYASLVSYFEQHPTLKNRPVILLIQPHLSMGLFYPDHLRPPNKESTVQGLRALVARWKMEEGLTVVSHSNGTIVHGWLLKDCPELVKASCFVDPVTFCLWEPFVAYNFLYRKPTTGIDILMRYFVGEEIGIALMLQRYFDWSANILWFEEIPDALSNRNTIFFLAEKDAILNARRVMRYLKDHGVKTVEEGGNLHFMKGVAHGEALIVGREYVTLVMDWLSAV
ncbi:hypothetical protein P389DRAFT_58697 [Cystobasidium minutum MCA 4210]|uniref:uncharacterized protein n=1 Tax=Cystobasidium minutum MCA 4210 TaxID=1397322 RepID=UPI0034CE5C9F|eukprot:jgi/Rhomi1/58697/CE58696_2486